MKKNRREIYKCHHISAIIAIQAPNFQSLEMVKPNQTAYLIIGTSRGIGKGLVKELLIRPDTLVVATIRNAKSSEAKELANLPVGNGSQLYIIEIEVSEPDSIRKAIATLNIDKLDVVISNAASK